MDGGNDIDYDVGMPIVIPSPQPRVMRPRKSKRPSPHPRLMRTRKSKLSGTGSWTRW